MPLFATVLLACASRSPGMPGPLRAVDGRPIGGPEQVETDGSESPARRPREWRKQQDDLGKHVADAALHWLDHAPSDFRDDCSGFVEASFARAGVEVHGSTADLWLMAEQKDAVVGDEFFEAGDLVFFDNTYDRNHNRRLDDALSHVGIVVDVLPSGVVWMAHAGTSQGRTTLAMDLSRPDIGISENGELVNGTLRMSKRSDPKGTPHLSSECFHGLARFKWDDFRDP